MKKLLLALLLLPIFCQADEVTFPTVKLELGAGTVTAELADTDYTRSQGLMYRKHLGKNSGMLIMLDKPQTVCMWMKNVEIPLSLAFINDHGYVLATTDMIPFSEQQVCSNKQLIRYVLEVNQGWFEKNAVQSGTRMYKLYDDTMEGMPVQ